MQTDLITKVYFNEHLTHSCVGMPHRLTKRVFMFDYQFFSNNWSSEIQSICSKFGTNENFINRTLFDFTEIKCIAKRLNEQEWREAIANKPKLRTYRLFKNDLYLEDYVKIR